MEMPPNLATPAPVEQKPKPLTEKVMRRIVGMGVSNGLQGDDFSLLWSEEDIYILQGLMILSPLFEEESSHQAGSAAPKESQYVPSLPQMREMIAQKKEAFHQNQAGWLPDAKAELKAMPGEGWGLDNAKIVLTKETQTYASTMSCADCRGTRSVACIACQATGYTMCRQCYGRGREDCPICQGTGRDAHDQNKPCYECQGSLLAPCRYCAKLGYMNGHIPCPTCHGKGGIPCQHCGGHGCFTEIVRVTAGAQTTFRLQTGGLPSGLNRALDRLGLQNLGKGHAKIEIYAPDKDDPELEGLSEAELQSLLHYRAAVPFADLMVSIKGQKMRFSVFGEKAAVLGLPPFLDAALTDARNSLAAASRSKSWLQVTKKYHAANLVLRLILQGKGTAQEVRRSYPIGLSPKTTEELLRNGKKALRSLTKTTRLIVSSGMFAISAALFSALFLSEQGRGWLASMPTWQAWGLKFSILPLLLAVTAFDLKMGAALTLRRYFPDQKNIRGADLGKIGWGLVVAITLIWVACALATKFLPTI